MKQLIKEVAPYKRLYRDTRTGIAWVEDGTVGIGHTCHPNIDASGSVRGMKKLYWGECRTVRSHGYIYNIDRLSVSGELDELARQHCQCGGNHGTAGETRLLIGTRVRVLSITGNDPDDAVGVVGSEGEITHPFGDSPDAVAGVWVTARGSVPPGVVFPSNRIGLCRGDRVKVLSTGEEVTL